MRKNKDKPSWKAILICTFLTLMMFAVFTQADVYAINLIVEDETGASITTYRWLLEEDNTHPVTPGQLVGDGTGGTKLPEDSLSLSIHKSYAPVIAKGNQNNPINIPDSAKRYFISVLPGSETQDPAYSMGGASIAAGQAEVTVYVNAYRLPTAQISIFVFEDNNPINNAPDLPETGLAGFDILVEDAGGRYGASAGHMIQDCFGNPLGTTYSDEIGTVLVLGSGVLRTGQDGTLLIKNICPGKYGIQVVPPPGQDWQQTSTIEGTKVIDAWVKAGEPSFFQEFGPPGHHVFIGFVRSMNDTTVLNGANAISGRIVNVHNSRPPDFTFHPGHPIPNCWIGLNDLAAGVGKGVYAQPCNEDSTFSIDNVPAGSYTLAIWDNYMDVIFGSLGVTVEQDGSCTLAGGTTSPGCSLGDVPVFAWFGRIENHVFYDADEDGYRDEGEPAIPEQATNIRWRDGTIYQSFPTDLTGYVPYDEVFPFFHWLVLEVDFARYKATGATIIVDGGGPVTLTDADGGLNPQAQICTSWDVSAGTLALNPDGIPETSDDVPCTLGAPIINPNTLDNLSRTETGEVLTQAFQSFLGTTSIVKWGKANYADGENGGISGIVYYATTRAEDDPQFAGAEVWEPGIPRVQVNLYEDLDQDGIIDDNNGDGCPTPADVNNYPFDNFPGSEDIKYVLQTGAPDCIFGTTDTGPQSDGDAVQTTTTDSWDDNLPAGCAGEEGIQQPFYVYGNDAIIAQDCFEGLRTFNQIRDGVFDGGYAFGDISAGTYIVEATLPPGYEHLRSQDRNVDFGEEYISRAAAAAAPLELQIVAAPPCVGDTYTVPATLSLFPGVEAPLKDSELPLCNQKQVVVKSGMSGGGFNSVADFFEFTVVPKASRVVGFMLDDLGNEFDQTSPSFGEKFAPPWLPVSIRDFKGKEISRVYADQWGKYNALIPSTYTENLPIPSGISPNMLTFCMNSPGPIEDPSNTGEFIIDPYYNRQYTQFCYTFQFMPGTTTYLDTPVLPVAAFPGANQAPLDCEFPDGTPVIYSVSGPNNGPYVTGSGERLEIVSAGPTEVLNPAYNGANNQKITRYYGFGDFVDGESKVTVGGMDLVNVDWANGVVRGDIPAGILPGSYQLEVTRGDNGRSTEMGVTVTVGGNPPLHVPLDFPTINEAVTAAPDDSLILVAPGTYEELVIIWKDVKLQGWGALSTFINAVKAPSEKLQEWRVDMEAVIGDPLTSPYLLPGQEGGFNLQDNEPDLFRTEEGPGIIVLGKNNDFSSGRIDGFTVFGADTGGGIFINGYTEHFEISNNRITGNQGTLGGGIRSGYPYLADEGVEVDAQSVNLNIHNNHITQNGTSAEGSGIGGGVALYSGNDGYKVIDNYICGNFSAGSGGGIGHLGLSKNGLIAKNKILFNQTFSQDRKSSGAGIFIGGAAPTIADPLSRGSGSVSVLSNLIQGNLAGAGDGGGIRTEFVNGQDVAASPDNSEFWYEIDLVNNMIVNNVSGLAGGGISMQDTANMLIINSTIANNDSTATAGAAFSAGPEISTPQVAGIVSRAHSDALIGAIGNGIGRNFEEFSSPGLRNSIIVHNRSFHWDVNENDGKGGLLPLPTAPEYNDLAVIGTPSPAQMNPQYCLLTSLNGYDPNNIEGDPGFVDDYFNGSRGYLVLPDATTALETQPAFDEGGNFIDVRFGPLTLTGNYHITDSSDAKDVRSSPFGIIPLSFADFDSEARPNPTTSSVDSGADEYYGPGEVSANIGPITINEVVVPNPTYGETLLTLTALATDVVNGNHNIIAAEWRIGSDPALPMTAQDGTFNSPTEIVTATINIGGLSDGNYIISVRSQDATNMWGAVNSFILVVDSGPGPDLVGPASTNVAADPNLTDGATLITLTATADDSGSGGSEIIAAEWWIAGLDLGAGNNTAMDFQDAPPHSAIEVMTASIDITGMADGDYTFFVRSQDDPGNWGPANSTILTINNVGGIPGAGSVNYQCPADTHGATVDDPPDGISDDENVVCIHLVAGDGFVKLADGNLSYIFSFKDVSSEDAVTISGDTITDDNFDPAGFNPYDPLDVLDAGFFGANLSAPSIVIKQGQKLYLTLTNVGMQNRPDLFDPHTIHWHGFPNASAIFDGVPDASLSINQLSSITYYYEPVDPGTYLYHCHVEATEHMQMGMYGNLYVTPVQDDGPAETFNGRTYTKFAYNDGDGSTGYDKDYPMQLSSYDSVFHNASYTVQPLGFAAMKDDYALINGRGYPDTANPDNLVPHPDSAGRVSQMIGSLITVNKGETILLRLNNLSVTEYFTVTVLGLPMKVVGKDTRELVSTSGEKLHYVTSSVNIGGGEAFDVILYTDDIPVGTYYLYTTNLNYLSNGTEDNGGMMTEIRIE